MALLLGACKESTNRSITYAENTTGHSISGRAYFQGNVNEYASFELAPHEKKEINENGGWGDKNGKGRSYGSTITFQDSILIIFDHADTIVHYKPTLMGGAKHFYPFSSTRNLYNEANYIETLIEKSSNNTNHYFLYTFTEQDYLDVKQ
jgi:hypothetical protein